MITQAIGDYLKAIYRLQETTSEVTTFLIAERLNVTQPSATGMVKKLAEMKLITYTPYQRVELSEAGRKIALEIIRHHRLLELYLAKAMGYSWDRVHAEAEKLEHFISEEFEEKMAEILGHPTSDPHGAPIPAKDGSLEERDLFTLTTIESGKKVRIRQISDKDSEKLRYLASVGVYPEVVISVMDKNPSGDAILVQIGEKEHYLSRSLTDTIFVSAVSEAELV